MRIIYDAAPLLNPLTGVGHYASSLLQEMLIQDREARFGLVAFTLRADKARLPVHDRVSVKHYRVPSRWLVTGWEKVGFPKGEAVFGRSDAVHGTNYWVPPLRKPNGVVTIHDLTFRLYPNMCTPQVQRYEWIVPKVLKRCSIVITHTEVIKAQVVSELGFPQDRIVVTRGGVRGTFKGATPDHRLERDHGIEGDYVLFMGSSEPRKNLDRLLQAFAALQHQVQLVIAGPPGWGGVDIESLANKLHLGKRVVITGYLPEAQIGSLVAGARLFAFPSLYEGFGLPPLEAMAAGVPVVAASAGALREVLGSAPFYCDPLDVDSIADALSRALSDEQSRQTAIKAGREQAAKYSWSETARLTLAAYRRI